MAEKAAATEDRPSKAVFIDEPGEFAGDALLGNNVQVGSEVYDLTEDDEPADEGGEEAEAAPAAGIAMSPEMQAELARMRALNDAAEQRQVQEAVNNRALTLNALLDQLDTAISFGDVDKAKTLKEQIRTINAQPVPTARPNQPGALAPSGHWANNIASEVQAFIPTLSWHGKDVRRMQALEAVGKKLDPVKFATKEEYFRAVTDSVEELVTGEKVAVNTQQRNKAPAPTQSGATAARVGPKASADGNAAPRGVITNISQLQPREREAAREAIRIGGIDEKRYLESYNAVVKQKASAAARAKR